MLDKTFSDSHSQPVVGSKRSVRDRLGSNADIQFDNKRQRGDGDRLGLRASNGSDDLHLRKDDLRFKIMKRTQSGGQPNGVDLRELLSRPARSSTTSLSPQERVPESRNGRQRMPESKHMPEPRDIRQHMDEPRDVRPRILESSDSRQRMLEPRDGRERMPEPRDGRHRMPEPRDGRQHIPQSRDGRQHMPEPRDGRLRIPGPVGVRHRIPDLSDDRQRISEPTTTTMPGRIHSTRSMEALPQMDLMRSSYSPWTLDHIRRKSPDRVLDKSRGLSPARNPEEPQRRSVMRTYDDLRNSTYMSRDIHELSRPGASFMTKPSLPAGPAKPAAPLVASQLPSAGVVARSSYSVDDQPTVEGFLHSLGLEKYAITFKVEEVDMHALRQMGDNDLKELGIPMGPRKKILLALLARSRRQVQVR